MEASELPFVDRHRVAIDASDDQIWATLGLVLTRGFAGWGPKSFGRIVGCEQRTVDGPPLVQGSTIVGFRVVESHPPRRVVLEGRHRFSRYRLTFEVEPDGHLCATTHAAFPGVHGRIYEALVVDSKAHVVAVKRILSRVKTLAEGAAVTT